MGQYGSHRDQGGQVYQSAHRYKMNMKCAEMTILLQHSPKELPGKLWRFHDKFWTNEHVAIFIPHKNERLKALILVPAHAGVAENRGKQTKLANIKGIFFK